VAVSKGYKNVYRDPYGFPQWQEAGLPVESAPAGLTPSTEANAPPTGQTLQGWAMIWALFGVFVGGLALNLTPCVYPMIPITVSFFGGRASHHQPSQLKLVVHGLCYILGLALTNSILGVVAALTGGLMGAVLQNPIVLVSLAAILVLFASSLFGWWELKLPGSLNQAAAQSYSGYFGSFFMGLTLGVVAAPCIGPFVLGLLTWVAGVGQAWFGFLVFFILSLGLGLPLFILAIFSGQLQHLPRAGGWMIWVRKVMGWVLVGMAVYFIRPILPEIYKILLPVAVALAAGVHLGWVDNSQSPSKYFAGFKTLVGTICLIFAAFWLSSAIFQGPGVSWKPYSQELLDRAAREKKPVIIDFYADWCAPCRELEDIVFHHPDVVKRGNEEFVMVKVDVTQGGNPFYEQLLQQYNVKGVPTVVFLDGQGKEHVNLRLVDYVPPEQFLVHMSSISE
jgi:thioredoxin:protein disulfide reductase